jgi:hypothetical protein
VFTGPEDNPGQVEVSHGCAFSFILESPLVIESPDLMV